MIKKATFLIFFFFILLFASYAQSPVADFSVDKRTGCDILIVKFTDLSTNNPISWAWNFGDASPLSSAKNPTHVYTSPGTYTVTLTATNASGNDTETKTAYIIVYNNPQPNFIGDTISGCQPLTVRFTDLSTADTVITNYSWDFGDGGSSKQRNPTYTYNIAGSFSVTLFIADGHGCSNSLTKNYYVKVDPRPTSSYRSSYNIACVPPLTVNFTDLSTGNVSGWLWDFGDPASGVNNTSTLQNPSHDYTSQGNYTVILTATSPNGCSHAWGAINHVRIGTFKATPVLYMDSVGCAPFIIPLTYLQDRSDDWYSCIWDFGDGSPTSTVQRPGHTYTTPGVYTITLISTNKAFCVDTGYLTVIVKDASVDFSVDDSLACYAPFTANFSDNSIDAVSWLWDFGDGATSTLQNPSHTYADTGTYTVTLSVIDSMGCTGTLTKTGLIEIYGIIANIATNRTQGCIPLTINFTDISRFSNLSTIKYAKTNWYWDFGDGTTSTLQNPTHIYTDTGVYTIKFVVTDIRGCKDSLTWVDYIRAGIRPTAKDFAADDTLGCHPFTVIFTVDSASYYTNRYRWDFGDGMTGTSSSPSVTHIYADTGYFTVTMVPIHNGCAGDTISKEDYIYVLPPKPDFTAIPAIGCDTPLTVQFQDLSQGAETWLWYFGDGDTSTLQNPSHVYHELKFYNVKLVVTNSNGCIDSIEYANFIRISDIIPGYSQDTVLGCQYNNLSFYDTSYSNTYIIYWEWDFGDGTTISGIDSLPTHYFSQPVHQYNGSGIYDVRLTVTDALGCKDSITKTSFITIHQLPSPKFTANPTDGCIPLVVSFNSSLSTAIAPATVVKWLWDFGDGSTDTVQNPIHTYPDTGQYTVTLTITDSEKCDSTLIKYNYVYSTFPYPSFTCDSITCYSSPVLFSNTSVGIDLDYKWDFGDGSPIDTLPNPSHIYSVDSTTSFNVSLTATDINGCDSTIVKTITISRPVPEFGSDSAVADCPPFATNFLDSSSSDVISWSWNFGDPISGNNNTSTIKNPQHVFRNAGLYDISLIVVNADGCTDTIIKPDYIFVDGPSGIFDFYPKNGCTPLTVTFVANAQNAETYYWIFGDGGSAMGDSVVYTYTNGTFFIPILQLEDSINIAMGDTVPCQVTIISEDSVKLISADVDFATNYDSTCVQTTIQFTDSSTANYNIDTWLWLFGDGDSSTLQHPTHTYDSTGTYDVTLIITVDTCIFTLTKLQLINIFNPPDIKYTYIDSIGCTPRLYEFYIQDSTITYPVISWNWDFGDGTPIDTNKNPTHLYYSTGTYNVNLVVIFQNGCLVNDTVPINVTVYPNPVADFNCDTNYVFINEIISFIDQSSGSNLFWYWDFGDGTTSTEQNPYHQYKTLGTFQVMLVVYTNEYCRDTMYCIMKIIEGIKIPNVFTPNGDGFNDILEIPNSGYSIDYFISIFNRWGVVVFESNTPAESWDGRTRSGIEATSGTYYYVLKAKSTSGKILDQKGFITLIR